MARIDSTPAVCTVSFMVVPSVRAWRFSNIIKWNFSLTLDKLDFYVDMSVWLFVGKQYYRLNGTFVVPTKFLCFPVSKIHWKTELYVLQESAIWLLLLVNVHLFHKAVKKFFLLQIGELII